MDACVRVPACVCGDSPPVFFTLTLVFLAAHISQTSTGVACQTQSVSVAVEANDTWLKLGSGSR